MLNAFAAGAQPGEPEMIDGAGLPARPADPGEVVTLMLTFLAATARA
ncbi:hypothetical protein ACWGE0_41065 [Lentzea sp. NPDC054927]